MGLRWRLRIVYSWNFTGSPESDNSIVMIFMFWTDCKLIQSVTRIIHDLLQGLFTYTARSAELCMCLRPRKLFCQRMFEALPRSSWMAAVDGTPFQQNFVHTASHWWTSTRRTHTSIMMAPSSALIQWMTRMICRSSILIHLSSYSLTCSTLTSMLWDRSTLLTTT